VLSTEDCPQILFIPHPRPAVERYGCTREQLVRTHDGRFLMTGAADKLKGKADELKGDIKQKIGEKTDNSSLQAEGLKDQASGEAKQAIGDLKDAADGRRGNA
jgi:uncharacterized protein YjbJ (UPF0337 family)